MNKFDLEKFGVQGLESKEMIEVDGGFIPFVAYAIEIVLHAAAADLLLDFNHYVEIGKQGAADGKAAAQK